MIDPNVNSGSCTKGNGKRFVEGVEMSTLSSCFNDFFRDLDKAGIQPPSRDVRVFESKDDHGKSGKLHLRREELLTVSEYEDRFEELMRIGYRGSSLIA
jgi:hypothetical protein